MNKVVISGGPHTGKTTLINSLAEKYPEFQYLPEPATVVLGEAQEKDELRWRELFDYPLEFCTRCMHQSLKSERTINLDIEFVFLDRSLVDTIAYSRRDHCEELVPQVKALALQAMYDIVLFCEPVGSISNRIENKEMADHTDRLLKEAYEEAGVTLFPIPAVDVPSRVKLVENILDINTFK